MTTTSHENGVSSSHTNGTKDATGDPKNPPATWASQKNSWTDPGPAAFDFRSDVVTTPTASMLHALMHTSLLDDVFREDTVTNELESYVAELTGHEAALLVMSGTMGNQLSIRTHLTQPPHSILADARSHIMQWEAGGLALLSSALSYPIHPPNNHHLTLPDILTHAVTSTDIHACPTRLICLENTLNGTILPLSSCHSISTWARAQTPPIKMHLDGARLWEAVAASAGSLREYCACFDSVSLCFSKGLGAPVGSIIVGSREFVERARRLRKPLGGGIRQAGVISAPARVALEERFAGCGNGGVLRGTHERARRVEEMWVARGGRLRGGKAGETNMAWFDIGKGVEEEERFVRLGEEGGVRLLGGGRVVVHYQIGEEGVRRLGRVMDAWFAGLGGDAGKGGEVRNDGVDVERGV